MVATVIGVIGRCLANPWCRTALAGIVSFLGSNIVDLGNVKAPQSDKEKFVNLVGKFSKVGNIVHDILKVANIAAIPAIGSLPYAWLTISEDFRDKGKLDRETGLPRPEHMGDIMDWFADVTAGLITWIALTSESVDDILETFVEPIIDQITQYGLAGIIEDILRIKRGVDIPDPDDVSEFYSLDGADTPDDFAFTGAVSGMTNIGAAMLWVRGVNTGLVDYGRAIAHYLEPVFDVYRYAHEYKLFVAREGFRTAYQDIIDVGYYMYEYLSRMLDSLEELVLKGFVKLAYEGMNEANKEFVSNMLEILGTLDEINYQIRHILEGNVSLSDALSYLLEEFGKAVEKLRITVNEENITKPRSEAVTKLKTAKEKLIEIRK